VPSLLPRSESAEYMKMTLAELSAFSVIMEAGPAVTLLARRVRETRAHWWVGAALGSWALEDCLLRWLGLTGHNNHWLVYLANPFTTALFLMAYADWAPTARTGRWIRRGIVVYAAVWAVLFQAFEDPTTFSRYTAPMQAILLLALGCAGIVHSLQVGSAPVWKYDLFWISSGLLLDSSATVLFSPVSALLLPSSPDRVMLYIAGKTAVSIVAYALVTLGMLCRPIQPNSGIS
jgi:hypothetical protein